MTTIEERTPLDELRDTVVALQTEVRELSELDEITPEQDARLDEAIAEFDTRKAELDRLEARAAAVQAVKDAATGSKPGVFQNMRQVEIPDVGDVRRMLPGELRSAAFKQLENKTDTEHLDDRQMAQVERLIRTNSDNLHGEEIAQRLLITERPAYRSAFMKKTLGKVTNDEENRALAVFEEYRNMNITTDGAGGFGVPVLIDPTIILVSQGSADDILAIANIKTITTDTWKGVSSVGVSWSFDAEGVEVSDDAPAILQPSVPVYTARGFIPFTVEVGQDYPGFAMEMSTLLDSGYRELLAEKLVVGSGSAEPTGIVTALTTVAGSEVVATTDGGFGAVDVYKIWAALPQRFRANSSWLSHTTTQNAIRAFDTAGGGQFTCNLTQEAVPSLFGRRYYLNDYIAAFTGTTGAQDFLVLGDFRNFIVAQRAGMSVELVPHLLSTTTNLPNMQRGWLAWARIGSDSAADNAFRLLVTT